MRALWITTTATLAACASPVSTPTRVPVVASSAGPASPPPALASPSYWVPAGPSSVGPRVPGGTLVLLNGRRALIRDDGTIVTETHSAPESLSGLGAVPTSSGERWVAIGARTVYRLDDPLGEPIAIAREPSAITRVSFGPGLIGVGLADEPLELDCIDVDGHPVPPPAAWPKIPIRRFAFRNERDGVVDFWVAGPESTSDGGKTFQPLVVPATGYRDRDPTAIRRAGSDVRLSFENGQSARVTDFAAGSSALEPETPDPVPTVQWLRRVKKAPVVAAVLGGLSTDAGRSSVVLEGGLLARVDLATGRVVEALDHVGTQCTLVRHGAEGLIGCMDGSIRSFSLDRPFVLAPFQGVHVPHADMLSSGIGGGVVIDAPCAGGEDEHSVCALQPNGVFATVPRPPNPDLTYPRAVQGAMADGRVAFFLRGDERHPARFAISDKDGATTLFPPLPFPGDGQQISADGGVEQAADGSLRVIAATTTEHPTHFAVAQPLDGRPATITDLHATEVLVEGGLALAFGDSMRLSTDAGETWAPVAEPGDRAVRSISEVGFVAGQHAHVGWRAAPPPLPGAEPQPHDRRDEPLGPPQLACTTERAAPYHDRDDVRSLFMQADGPEPPDAKRLFEGFPGYVPFAAPGSFEAFAPKRDAKVPARWTVRWIDPQDATATMRSWTTLPPPAADWSAHVRQAAVAPGREFLAIADGKSGWLALSSHDGLRLQPYAQADSIGEVYLGVEGAPIVWMQDWSSIVAWLPGTEPHVLAKMDSRPNHFDLAPGKNTVSLFVPARHHAWVRDIPLGAAPPSSAPPTPWQLVDFGTGPLPVCAPKATGRLFHLAASERPSLTIDGAPAAGQTREYAVRVNGTAACLAGVSLTLDRSRDSNALGEISVPLAGGAGVGHETGSSPRLRTVKCTAVSVR